MTVAAPYYHKGVTKADAEELVAGKEDGTFLVRPKGQSRTEFILTVVFKGNPTHHALKVEDGAVTLNKKGFGGHGSIEALLAALSTKQPGWPVGLDKPLHSPDAAAVQESNTVADSDSEGEDNGSDTPWLHGKIDKAAAEALLLADGGADETGKFLVRSKGAPGQYIVSVVFKGKPTHHMLSQEGSGDFTINKQPTGAASVPAAVEYLRSKRPKWPLQLASGVPAGGAAAAPPPAAAPTPAPAAAPEPAPPPAAAASAARSKTPEPEPAFSMPKPREIGRLFEKTESPGKTQAATPVKAAERVVGVEMTPYFHGDIGRAKAEALLLRESAEDSKIMGLLPASEAKEREQQPARRRDGKYLLWESSDGLDAWVSIIANGAVQHHELTKDFSGVYSLRGGVRCGGCTELSDFVVWASTSKPGWPVALVVGVPGLRCLTLAELAQHEVDQKKADLETARDQRKARRASLTHDRDEAAVHMLNRRREQAAEEEAAAQRREEEYRRERAAAQAEAKAALEKQAKIREAEGLHQRRASLSPAQKEAARQERLAQLAGQQDLSAFANRIAAARNIPAKAAGGAESDSDSDSDDGAGGLAPLQRSIVSSGSGAEEFEGFGGGSGSFKRTSSTKSNGGFEGFQRSGSTKSNGGFEGFEAAAPASAPFRRASLARRNSLDVNEDAELSSATYSGGLDQGAPALDPDEFMHPDIGRVQAEGMLTEAMGTSANGGEGAFLLRRKGRDEWVLSAIMHGRVAHHQIKPGNGGLTISGQDTGCTDPISLVEMLRGNPAVPNWWPTRLMKPLAPLSRSEAKGIVKRQSAREKSEAKEVALTRARKSSFKDAAGGKLNRAARSKLIKEALGVLNRWEDADAAEQGSSRAEVRQNLHRRVPDAVSRVLRPVPFKVEPECTESIGLLVAHMRRLFAVDEKLARLVQRDQVLQARMADRGYGSPTAASPGDGAALFATVKSRVPSSHGGAARVSTTSGTNYLATAPLFDPVKFRQPAGARASAPDSGDAGSASPTSPLPAGLQMVKFNRSSLVKGPASPAKQPAAKSAAPPAAAPQPAAAAAPTPARAATPEPDPAPQSGGGGAASYLHPGLKKADAEALLLADGGADKPGKFLIRSKGTSTDEFILSVVYKGAATHHTLARVAEGEDFALNKVPTGCSTFEELVAKYGSKQPKWPVPLTEGVPGSAGAAPAAAPATPGRGGGGGGGNGGEDAQFLHSGLNKADAEALLLADGGADDSGKFLVRTKGASGNDFILSVVYKGAPTHHALSRPDEGSDFTLNKAPTGQNSIGGVITAYRSKRPKWPVPLTTGVPAQ